MTTKELAPYLNQRWMHCRFDPHPSYAGSIQQFGVMEWTGAEVVDGQTVITVQRVNGGGVRNTCFNGGQILDSGGYGVCTFEGPLVARYSKSSVDPGDVLAPDDNLDTLEHRITDGGYRVMGVVDEKEKLALVRKERPVWPRITTYMNNPFIARPWLTKSDAAIGRDYEGVFTAETEGIRVHRDGTYLASHSTVFTVPSDYSERLYTSPVWTRARMCLDDLGGLVAFTTAGHTHDAAISGKIASTELVKVQKGQILRLYATSELPVNVKSTLSIWT